MKVKKQPYKDKKNDDKNVDINILQRKAENAMLEMDKHLEAYGFYNNMAKKSEEEGIQAYKKGHLVEGEAALRERDYYKERKEEIKKEITNISKNASKIGEEIIRKEREKYKK